MRISPSYCPTCGADPCINPVFCALCRENDARGAAFFEDGPELPPHSGPDPHPGPNGHGPASSGHAPEQLREIDMSDWDLTPTPTREWAVPNRIPLEQTTLFSGEGETGKSIIELQLCVAHVLGRDWLGSMPEQRPAFYFAAEDNAKEIRIRLTGIAKHYGVTFADLIAAGLHLFSYTGEDALLATADRWGNLTATPLYDLLFEAAGDIKPVHIGLDTSADVFGGNESERRQVKRFVGMLTKMAIVARGSVVLLSHPSLTGISSGSGLSGSTGWHNSVRARMYLTRPSDNNEDADEDLRELQFLKNNYGRRDRKLSLRWCNGLFLPAGSQATPQQQAAESRADDMFMDLLTKLAGQGQHVSDKSGTTYAPAQFAQQPEAKKAKISKRQFADAMVRLLSAGKVHVHWEGPPSRARSYLKLGPKPGWIQPDLTASTDPSTDLPPTPYTTF
jgi:RecA-family ATPase